MTEVRLNELLSPYSTYAARNAAELREAIRRAGRISRYGHEATQLSRD